MKIEGYFLDRNFITRQEIEARSAPERASSSDQLSVDRFFRIFLRPQNRVASRWSCCFHAHAAYSLAQLIFQQCRVVWCWASAPQLLRFLVQFPGSGRGSQNFCVKAFKSSGPANRRFTNRNCRSRQSAGLLAGLRPCSRCAHLRGCRCRTGWPKDLLHCLESPRRALPYMAAPSLPQRT